MESRRTCARRVAALVLVTLLVAACGGGTGGDGDAPASAAASASSPATSPTRAAGEGDESPCPSPTEVGAIVDAVLRPGHGPLARVDATLIADCAYIGADGDLMDPVFDVSIVTSASESAASESYAEMRANYEDLGEVVVVSGFGSEAFHEDETRWFHVRDGATTLRFNLDITATTGEIRPVYEAVAPLFLDPDLYSRIEGL